MKRAAFWFVLGVAFACGVSCAAQPEYKPPTILQLRAWCVIDSVRNAMPRLHPRNGQP